MHRRLLAAALILVLVVVGSQVARAQPQRPDVTVSDAKGFDPAFITINAGGTVLWMVDENATVGHSVTSDDSSEEVFDSSPDCDVTPGNDNCLKPGDTFDHTFEVPGTYTYHDRANPTNQGEVIVLQVATTTSTPETTTSTTTPATTTEPTTTSSSTTTTGSTTTSTSSTTTTTLIPVTTSDSSDVTVKDGGGGDSNAPLLAGAAIVVAGLAGAAWWAYNRGGPPMDPGGPYDDVPPTTMG